MIEKGVENLVVKNNNSEIVGILSSIDVTRDIALDNQDTFPYLRSLFKIPTERKTKFQEKVKDYVKGIEKNIYWRGKETKI